MKNNTVKLLLLLATCFFAKTTTAYSYYDDRPFPSMKTSSSDRTSTIAIGATIGAITGVGCNYFEKIGPLHWAAWWFIWRQIRSKLVEAASHDLKSRSFEQQKSLLLAAQLPLLLLPHEEHREPKEALLMKNSAWITDWLVYLLMANV